MRKFFALLTASILSVSLAACAGTETVVPETVALTTESLPPATTTKATTEAVTLEAEALSSAWRKYYETPYETTASTIDETTGTTIIIDGQKIYGEEYFISSWQGMHLKIASFKAARAFLSNNKDDLASYLLYPDEIDEWVFWDVNEPNIYDSLGFITLLGVEFFSETEVYFTYAIAGETWDPSRDSDEYINVLLVKREDEWKVQQIGLEG